MTPLWLKVLEFHTLVFINGEMLVQANFLQSFGTLYFTALNFITIDQIYTKFGNSQGHFIINMNSSLIESIFGKWNIVYTVILPIKPGKF